MLSPALSLTSIYTERCRTCSFHPAETASLLQLTSSPVARIPVALLFPPFSTNGKGLENSHTRTAPHPLILPPQAISTLHDIAVTQELPSSPFQIGSWCLTEEGVLFRGSAPMPFPFRPIFGFHWSQVLGPFFATLPPFRFTPPLRNDAEDIVWKRCRLVLRLSSGA